MSIPKGRVLSAAFRFRIVTGTSLLLATSIAQGSSGEQKKADWTVMDSVSWPSIGSEPQMLSASMVQAPIIASPNGRYFVLLHTRADPDKDLNVGYIDVFDSNNVLKGLRTCKARECGSHVPYDRVAMFSPRMPIRDLTWSSDGTCILFIGSNGGAEAVYRYNVRTKKLSYVSEKYLELPNSEISLVSFRISKDVLILRISTPSKTSNEPYPMHLVNRNSSGSVVLTPRAKFSQSTLAQYKNYPIRKLGSSGTVVVAFPPLPSPNGRYILYLQRDKGTSSSYVMIDLLSGRQHKVLAGPTVELSGSIARDQSVGMAKWLGQESVIVIQPDPKDGGALQHANIFAISDGHTQALRRIRVFPPINLVDGDAPNKILLSQGGDQKNLVIERDGDTFVVKDGRAKRQPIAPADLNAGQGGRDLVIGDLRVWVSEGLNVPVKVIASAFGRHSTLFDSAPNGLPSSWTRQAPFQWTEAGGKVGRGVLTYPKMIEGPLPLVVQVSIFDDFNFFEHAGPFSADFATQVLASKGIAVLNINYQDMPGNGSGAEGEQFRDRLDAAVLKLAATNRIDPSRVGLIGFSRSGYLTWYASTHPNRVVYAASISADSTTMTLFQDLIQEPMGVPHPPGQAISGNGKTFWQSQKEWLDTDVIFNTKNIRTPQLWYDFWATGEDIQSIHPVYLAAIGAMQQMRRPFDYAFFPNAWHPVIRPRQRAEAMQLSVDWMLFWLSNVLPADPTLSDRWSMIRRNWDRQKQWEAAGHDPGSEPK